MEWKELFKKTRRADSEPAGRRSHPEVPEGLLKKCNACKAAILTEDVKKGYYTCPKCHNYFRVHAYRRIEMIGDEGSFEEWDRGLPETNPLKFKGYDEKLVYLKNKTKLDEAVITGQIRIDGQAAAVGVCDGRFMMASMGQVVGEKITRAVERATEEKLPMILFACSGGARMQEGIVSLMQMAKTAAALKRHSDAGLLYITVLTDPTTGGVTASFAMLGDIILAEPGALIGFAGPRVIEQTIGEKLPKGFQRSEFLLEHGVVDRIVEREEQKQVLSQILKLHGDSGKNAFAPEPFRAAQGLSKTAADAGQAENVTFSQTENALPGRGDHSPAGPAGNASAKGRNREKQLSAWDRVLLSRRKDRPVGTDYIQGLFTEFIEFHGDRYCRDDRAIVGGVARFDGTPVTVIAQEKGKTTRENMNRNFGMPSPDGYRKALRLMKQAEKFGRPVICFVDTPGAFCGMEAEKRGQGEAIARNLYEMSALKVPVLSLVIGEGGSGGALGMAVANEVWMMENAVYSVLSPEGFASILWKDSKRAAEAAGVMKLTSRDLQQLGVIDQVIPEPEPLNQAGLRPVLCCLRVKIDAFLQKYRTMTGEQLSAHRYGRFRKM